MTKNKKGDFQFAKNSKLGASKKILTLLLKDKDGKELGVVEGYREAAKLLGVDEKTVRNTLHRNVGQNRSGFSVEVLKRGGVAVEPCNKF